MSAAGKSARPARTYAEEYIPAVCAVTEAEAASFEAACRRALLSERERAGIGTLSEKTLHATVKAWIAPEGAVFETPVGSYVADVMGPDGHIYEVQTQGFFRLRGKIDAFLPSHPVTIVYPYALRRHVCDLPQDPTAPTRVRRSTRPGKLPLVFDELYRIKPQLSRPGLAVCLLLLEVTDYRLPRPAGADRAGERLERMPRALLGRVTLASPRDYAALLPPGLPDPFGTADVALAARVRKADAQTMLNVLSAVGAVSRVGKKGNAILYRTCDDA